VIAAMLGLAAAAAQPSVVLTLDPSHQLVEGVATDGSTIFVSSVLDRQILACRRTCRTIATLPAPLHPLGIAWDWGRKLVWIAADCPGVLGMSKCDKGALVALSPSGRIRARLAPKGVAFHPGDVSAASSGIFVSDSQSGLVWSLLRGRPGLRAVNRPGDGKSAQGTALAPSGTAVIVADYSRGIGSIDLKSTATTWLPRRNGKPLQGIDGLLRCGDSFIGVYNGETPGKLIAIKLLAGSIEYRELVARQTLPDPTQIAFDGKRLLAVADSGWDALGRGIGKRAVGAHIVSLPVLDACRSL
jgi:hypothetical protein